MASGSHHCYIFCQAKRARQETIMNFRPHHIRKALVYQQRPFFVKERRGEGHRRTPGCGRYINCFLHRADAQLNNYAPMGYLPCYEPAVHETLTLGYDRNARVGHCPKPSATEVTKGCNGPRGRSARSVPSMPVLPFCPDIVS